MSHTHTPIAPIRADALAAYDLCVALQGLRLQMGLSLPDMQRALAIASEHGFNSGSVFQCCMSQPDPMRT